MPNLALSSTGITFPDSTTQTTSATAAGAIGTTQLAANSVTAAKLGTNEQKQICKSWANFNGAAIYSGIAASSTLVVTAGSNQGTWNYTAAFNSGQVGCIYYFNIGGTNATLGGVNVSTVGVQITSFVSANQVTFVLLAGNATSTQTVTGTGAAGGYSFSTSGIRSSYNVSSITKNATGDYTVNFTNAMADSNYSVGGSASSIIAQLIMSPYTPATMTTSSCRIYVTNTSVGGDNAVVCVQIFGN